MTWEAASHWIMALTSGSPPNAPQPQFPVTIPILSPSCPELLLLLIGWSPEVPPDNRETLDGFPRHYTYIYIHIYKKQNKIQRLKWLQVISLSMTSFSYINIIKIPLHHSKMLQLDSLCLGRILRTSDIYIGRKNQWMPY